MTTFVLVHGGAHGSWCSELVVPELEASGHRVVTPDLPIEDDDADLNDWAASVIEEIPPDAGDDIILVGHSMAGLVYPWSPLRYVCGGWYSWPASSRPAA